MKKRTKKSFTRGKNLASPPKNSKQNKFTKQRFLIFITIACSADFEPKVVKRFKDANF